MKRRTRINYTPEQKAIIWDRYKQGDSLHDIARMFDRYHSSIMPTIHQTGGYRPPVRKRHRLGFWINVSNRKFTFILPFGILLQLRVFYMEQPEVRCEATDGEPTVAARDGADRELAANDDRGIGLNGCCSHAESP